MAVLGMVIERATCDPAFRAALLRDPAAALSRYPLEAGDLEVLAEVLEQTAGPRRAQSPSATQLRTSFDKFVAGSVPGSSE